MVMSVNVTRDCACGAGGGGFLFGVSELYDLPVRVGVGLGDGCWATTENGAMPKHMSATSGDKRKRIACIKSFLLHRDNREILAAV